MVRRFCVVAALAVVMLITSACTNKKVHNPLANVNSKQSDKVLFDRAMDAMKHNRFEVARITLQTMINTYPDSEYLARAKLAVADSWYAEGGSAALAQAEAEYKDFETFFPNMPEAAEAQLKIANIHYSQMEKPDRDFTHAMRAEEEYRQVILQYPDNKKMVEEARGKLLNVQEIIAEREFRVGRFYFLRDSYPASIARLRSLTDKYPLYSKADEALFMLGQAYEGEIALIRARPSRQLNEVQKGAMIQEFTRNATEAYSRIVSRYPLMDRADDAKMRLAALHQAVPKPTKAAIAQNRAEENSRRESGMLKTIVGNFQKHPDTSQAAKVGQPTLVDPQMTTASEVVQEANRAARGPGSGSKEIAVETIGTGAPPPNQEAPRSDAPPAAAENNGQPPPADSNELKPNVAPDQPATTANDASELKPNVASDPGPAAPPQQVNEIQPGTQPADPAAASSPAPAADQSTDEDSSNSSSKHKKKKGLKKIVPF